MYQCAFCYTPLLAITNGVSFYDVSCLRCGVYHLSIEAEAFIEQNTFTQEQAANISGYVRENQGLSVFHRDIERLKLLLTPSVAEKAEKLLLVLTKRYPIPGEIMPVAFGSAEERLFLLLAAAADKTPIGDACDDSLRLLLELQGVCWARSLGELRYLLTAYFTREGWAMAQDGENCVLLPRGWAVADERRKGTVRSDRAFVAMAFRDALRPLYDEGLAPGIARAGYEAVRVDRVHHNNRIDDEIIARIRGAKFLVADFTMNRGGIYYEAGFAKGLGREVIWTIREDRLGRVHFDNRQYNFVIWTPNRLSAFAEALQLRIEATIGKGPIIKAD